jgi:hypothetical protein
MSPFKASRYENFGRETAMQPLTDLQQANELVKALFVLSCLLVIIVSAIPVVVVYPALQALVPPDPHASDKRARNYTDVTYPVFLLWGLWFLFPLAPSTLYKVFWDERRELPRWFRIVLPILPVILFLPVLLSLSVWLAGAPFSVVLATFVVVWLGPILLSWVLLIAVEVVIHGLLRRFFGAPSNLGLRVGTRAPGAVYAGLRVLALATRRAQLDSSLNPECPVYGVLMEFGFDEGTSSLFALADGHASLYGSGGGGTLGAGLHENVRQFVRPFIETANRCLSHMKPTDSFPVPEAGQTTFYFLTDSGALTAGGPTKELGVDGHPLSTLVHAGHEVLTQCRYVPWRSAALSILMGKNGTAALPAERSVWGVLREVGQPAANTHALLASADGSAGVYSLWGAGLSYPGESPKNVAKAKRFIDLIGAGIAVSSEVPENLAQANARFIETADRLVGHMQPLELFSVPAERHTTFYVGTRAGILSGSGLTEDLEADRHPLSPLYRAAEEVNEQGRLASQAARAGLTSR